MRKYDEINKGVDYFIHSEDEKSGDGVLINIRVYLPKSNMEKPFMDSIKSMIELIKLSEGDV